MLDKYLKHMLEKEERNPSWLAKKSGLTRQTIHHLIKTPNWTLESLKKVSDGFGIKPTTFLTRAEKHEKGLNNGKENTKQG